MTLSPTPAARDTAWPVTLRVDGVEVAAYERGDDVEPALSPRPYLHPVRTLAGTEVTELRPADHLHHLGVSVAVADVSGTSFWGGRTFTRDRGSVLLDNHGRQEHLSWLEHSPTGRTELLSWTDPWGAELVREERDLTAFGVDEHTWALGVASRLRNTSGRELSIGSPATNGRPGAGYGGFFWRAPASTRPPRCLGPGLEGEEALHGSRAPWLAMAGHSPDGAPWTLVFCQQGPERDPWFLRAAEYPGVGAALAWDTPLPLPVDGALTRRVVTLVADGHPTDVASLVAAALAPHPR